MPSKIFKAEKLTLDQFARKHKLTLLYIERDFAKKGRIDRWYCRFEKCEISRDIFLISTFGNGKTKAEAKKNYAKEISGQLLVFYSGSADRKEIWCPQLKI